MFFWMLVWTAPCAVVYHLGPETVKNNFLFLSEVWLVYSAVFLSSVQQRDSVYWVFPMFFSVMIYHRVLKIVLCALQYDIFFHSKYTRLLLLIPNPQSILLPPPPPLATTTLFSVSVILFLFHRKVHLCHFLKEITGTSLVIQWLRLHAPSSGDLGSIPGQGNGSHISKQRPTGSQINTLIN